MERGKGKDKTESPTKKLTRRTTLTLPSDCLDRAAQIASERHVNLSVVMTEALTEGLRSQLETSRADEILGAYKKAFAGFSEEELMLLDSIILQPTPSKNVPGNKRPRMGTVSLRHEC
ncbi:MAG: hypothetical protein QOJ99_2655 [Bryobacterales bacterium]|jgi:hypothetical protein|nr:hypothetical protein [Bryobacterales bacterium]